MHRADELIAGGKTRRARSLLRRATHDLRLFRGRLNSRRAKRLLSPSARDVMIGLAGPLGLDLKALVPPAGR
jgi:hypothetical protein